MGSTKLEGRLGPGVIPKRFSWSLEPRVGFEKQLGYPHGYKLGGKASPTASHAGLSQRVETPACWSIKSAEMPKGGNAGKAGSVLGRREHKQPLRIVSGPVSECYGKWWMRKSNLVAQTGGTERGE